MNSENRIQESVISQMGSIASHMFPNINNIAFKGSFRFGMLSALEKSNFQDFDDVINQPWDTKMEFFNSVLEKTLPNLKLMGLSTDQRNSLLEVLKKQIKL